MTRVNVQTVAVLFVLCFPAELFRSVSMYAPGDEAGRLGGVLLCAAYVAFAAVMIPLARTIGMRACSLWICGCAAVCVVAALQTVLHGNTSPSNQSAVLSTLAEAVAFGGFACYAAVAGRHVAAGTAVALDFPLRTGSYLVMQGGSIGALNHHVRVPAQRYALDIVAAERSFAMRGFFKRRLSDFPSYGVPVCSPCAAIVRAAVDGLPDEGMPSTRRFDGAAGNHVVLEYAGALVLLAHLKCGTVAVREGDVLRAGDIVGSIGNSGNSTEPHLHVHVEREEFGVPMLFAGRFLVRNSTITL